MSEENSPEQNGSELPDLVSPAMPLKHFDDTLMELNPAQRFENGGLYVRATMDPDQTMPGSILTPTGQRIELHPEVLALQELAAKIARAQAIDHDIKQLETWYDDLREQHLSLMHLRDQAHAEIANSRTKVEELQKFSDPTR